MKQRGLFLLFLVVSIYFLKKGNTPSETPILHISGIQMGMVYHISVVTPSPEENRSKILEIVQNVFAEVDTLYNNWNPNSEISRLNQWPAHLPFPLSQKLHAFLQKIDPLVRWSEGLFDPTIGPLKAFWIEALQRGTLPVEEEIEAMRPYIGWEKLLFQGKTVTKQDSRTQLDLGGVAKGFCVDLCTDVLLSSGFRDILVEWGGEIRGSGQHPSGRAWRVCIVPPPNFLEAKNLLEVEIIDTALATSGNYLQKWKAEGKWFTHILHPKTLQAVEITDQSISSSTLQAPDCLTADALSKIFLLFPDYSQAAFWLETHPDIPLKSWLMGNTLSFNSNTFNSN